MVDLGPFKVKSHKRAPVSKDIALETFLATVEINYLMPIELVMSPKVTFQKPKIWPYANYVRPKIWWLD